MLFALIVGLPLGILAAIKSGSWVDHLSRLVSLLGASMPPFWSGLMVLFLFYYKLQILPGPGRIDSRLTAPPTATGLYLVDTLLRGDTQAFGARCIIRNPLSGGSLALIVASPVHRCSKCAWTSARRAQTCASGRDPDRAGAFIPRSRCRAAPG
jgi:peptide/nickel transport system permease protein